jgi:hypothetical protein
LAIGVRAVVGTFGFLLLLLLGWLFLGWLLLLR